MSHTPGPWHCGTSYYSGRGFAIASGPYIVATVVGTGYPTGIGWSPESEANARLIAAAPDMLEALESIYTDDDGDGYTSAEGMAAINAAIAKARRGW